MKKIIAILAVIILCTAGICIAADKNTTDSKNVPADISISIYDFAVEKGNVWTPTFQLCWNELIKLTGRDKIEYVQGNSDFVENLNKQYFTANDLSEESYYTAVGKQTLKFKKKIEKDIKKKFSEKSDILDMFDFPNIAEHKTDKWFIYSILIKNFEFKAPFDKLENDYFNNVETEKYKYFGYMKNMKKSGNIKSTEEYITPLFYVSDDDFALKITDKTNKDEMILYLTNSDKSFNDIYAEILIKQTKQNEYTKDRINEITSKYHSSRHAEFKFEDYYKIPYLNINETINYDNETAGKAIKDKNYERNNSTWEIAKTVQTIKFNMDNKGAKLKSEAAISVMRTSMVHDPEIVIDNYYYFDRPFVIFLKEVNKDKPYFAARINNGKFLVK